MLDLPCPHCGEPWDNDELHGSEFLDYTAAFQAFKAYGCGAFDAIYDGAQLKTCSNAPIFNDEYMVNIRAGWAEAEYAEDIAAWQDMMEAIDMGFEF